MVEFDAAGTPLDFGLFNGFFGVKCEGARLPESRVSNEGFLFVFRFDGTRGPANTSTSSSSDTTIVAGRSGEDPVKSMTSCVEVVMKGRRGECRWITEKEYLKFLAIIY